MTRLESVFRLKDLEVETGIASATLYRYLVSLTQSGLVQRVEGSSRYALGLLAFQLGQRAAQGNDVVSLVASQVQEFANLVGETCAIGVWFDGRPTMVRWFEVNRAISISLRLGGELPLLASSTAKALAAWLPHETTRALLLAELARSGRPASDAEAIYAQWRQVRQRGIAQGLGRHIRGISSLSAPVVDHSRQAALAITVIGNQLTFDASLKGENAQRLKALSIRLSSFLGGSTRDALHG